MVLMKKDKSDGNCCSTLHFNCTWVPINVQCIFLHYERTVTCCPKRMGEHFVPSCEVSRTVSVVSTPAASSQVGEVLDVASLPQGQAHGAGCHGCGVGAVLSTGTAPDLNSLLRVRHVSVSSSTTGGVALRCPGTAGPSRYDAFR